MANFSIVIVPTKKLANGRHRIRIAVAHRSKTRYIPTQFTLDSASQLKKWQSNKTRKCSKHKLMFAKDYR